MFVHVVMTCWNRLEATQRALPALLDLTAYPEWAVTVVDDASTDGTRRWLEAEMERRKSEGLPNFGLVLHDKQRGTNESSNEGWAMYAGWYVKFDNNVFVLQNNWLTTLVDIAQALGPDRAGIVAHNIEIPARRYDPVTVAGCEVIDRTGHNVAGKCALVPEWSRERIGMWNTNIGTPYRGADRLYALRLCLAGLGSFYAPELGYVDRVPDTITETPERRAWRARMKRESYRGVKRLQEQYCSGLRPISDWSKPL